MANCYLQLGDTSQAARAAERAQQLDSANIHTQYLLLRIALAEHKEQQGTVAHTASLRVHRHDVLAGF